MRDMDRPALVAQWCFMLYRFNRLDELIEQLARAPCLIAHDSDLAADDHRQDHDGDGQPETSDTTAPTATTKAKAAPHSSKPLAAIKQRQHPPHDGEELSVSVRTSK
jgi:hypothetical protein